MKGSIYPRPLWVGSRAGLAGRYGGLGQWARLPPPPPPAQPNSPARQPTARPQQPGPNRPTAQPSPTARPQQAYSYIYLEFINIKYIKYIYSYVLCIFSLKISVYIYINIKIYIFATRSVDFVNSWAKIRFDSPARPPGRPAARPLPKRLENSRFWPADLAIFTILLLLRLGWGFTRCPQGVFGEDTVLHVIF